MLKNIKKGIATLGVLCILMCGTIYLPVNAADTTTDQGKGDVSYDMEVGGTQEFDVITEDGQEAHVTITEIPSMSRVANGTYRVKYDLTGCWIAGFNVKVSNNSSVSVSSPFHTIRLGYISSPKLTLNMYVTNLRSGLEYIVKEQNDLAKDYYKKIAQPVRV